MSEIISWIAAESDRRAPFPSLPASLPTRLSTSLQPVRQIQNSGERDLPRRKNVLQHPPHHQFPAAAGGGTGATSSAGMAWASDPLYNETDLESEILEQRRRRRVYRGRTAAMLRRYMRYSLETGRIPSILGGDIFRSKVTTYGVATFEDRAIFVHDMEKCLQRLDELSQQIVARVVLQGHDQDEAARLLGCTRKTIYRNLMEALDRMAEILLEVGLLEALPVEEPRFETSSSKGPVEKSCQGGEVTDFLLSDCDDGK